MYLCTVKLCVKIPLIKENRKLRHTLRIKANETGADVTADDDGNDSE